jgi:hypothetical protein
MPYPAVRIVQERDLSALKNLVRIAIRVKDRRADVAEGCINSDLGLARLAANSESDWPSA